MAGVLYLVPTPIGNLGDMTQRAVDTLKTVSRIVCEDTRTSAVLLRHYGIETPTSPFHKFNEHERLDSLVATLQTGGDLAIITDAGMPGISDPAYLLVRAAIDAGITVCPLPGATAFLPALIASGLPPQPFLFIGFPPDKPGDFKRLLTSVRDVPATLLFYESPHRFQATLRLLSEVLGNRRAAIARELTKVHESFYRGTIAELLATEIPDKGEFVLVIGGATRTTPDDDELRHMLREAIREGQSVKSAATTVAELTGARPNHVYRLGLALEKDPGV